MYTATERELERLGVKEQDCVEIAGYDQATVPLRKQGRDVNVAEIHDCFTVMGAIGTKVLGKAGSGEGTRY